MKPCNALPSRPKHLRPLCPRGGSSRLRKCRPCRDTCESMHRSGKTHNGSITLQTGAAILNSTTSGPCRLWSCRIGLPSTLWCECLPANNYNCICMCITIIVIISNFYCAYHRNNAGTLQSKKWLKHEKRKN